jgi:hypothetical protein
MLTRDREQLTYTIRNGMESWIRFISCETWGHQSGRRNSLELKCDE